MRSHSSIKMPLKFEWKTKYKYEIQNAYGGSELSSKRGAKISGKGLSA